MVRSRTSLKKSPPLRNPKSRAIALAVKSKVRLATVVPPLLLVQSPLHKRRTRVVRVFHNPESCLRLVRALCVETYEAWLEENHYINMDLLRQQRRKVAMNLAARSVQPRP